jgi:hypothetical protein
MVEEEETQALTDTDEGARSAAGDALLALYHDLPGDVVAIVEYERQAIVRDTLEHLQHIRDALAPYGKFREWCVATGLNYGTVSNRLSRASRPAINEPLTDLLLSAPTHAQVLRPDEPLREVLALGLAFRLCRDEMEPDLYAAWRWVWVWAKMLDENRKAREAGEETITVTDEAIARVSAVIAWAVNAAEAAGVRTEADLSWAITDEMRKDLYRQMVAVQPEPIASQEG